jgi:type VI secretion system protein ImpC
MTQSGAQSSPEDRPQIGEVSQVQLEDFFRETRLKEGSTAATRAKHAVRTFIEQVVADHIVPGEATDTIKEAITRIDEKLTEQVNEILHHAEFQQVEAAWRGLHHFVSQTQTDARLKIKVMNVSKAELAKHFTKYKGSAWDQSPLFKTNCEFEYGTAGGEPYGALIGDYYFDHGAADVNLLRGIAQIACAAHCPFVASAAPALLGMESWEEINTPPDLQKIVAGPEHAAWRSFRDSEDARYVGLTLPRFLARQPYDPRNNPVDGFAFVEDTAGSDHGRFCWANAAYAMATNITRAHKSFGWCSMIRGKESGGLVESLPVHTFETDDGGVDVKCPTEVSIPGRREQELEKAGLMALIHWKNTDHAAFLSATSVHKPADFGQSAATDSAVLSSKLNYLFAACRFAHYVKAMVRDKIGSFKERADMQRWLTNWVNQYVLPNPQDVSEEMRARKPLAEANIEVRDVEGAPGYYEAHMHLRPHFQLEGLTTTMSLVSRIPSVDKK